MLAPELGQGLSPMSSMLHFQGHLKYLQVRGSERGREICADSLKIRSRVGPGTQASYLSVVSLQGRFKDLGLDGKDRAALWVSLSPDVQSGVENPDPLEPVCGQAFTSLQRKRENTDNRVIVLFIK